ncbi:MFS transporter [Streptomyces griseofuscus]|uniref:MFS transporter n=1 Tax=Streptomyces griseofuscus TaxID=146922 RepID=A0A3R8QI13_9ACTN|nr:MFS transporter [Streptomyces griseofuscus]RRQ86607.1 hypothetical protein CQW44_12225 [Streptomyces griseofuscus]
MSLVGTWMQAVAQSWLILEPTGLGTVLGLVVAVQFLPVPLLGPYGGLVADRADKRRLPMATQTALVALALILGLLTISRLVRLWMSPYRCPDAGPHAEAGQTTSRASATGRRGPAGPSGS